LTEAAVKTFELQFMDTAQRERFRDNSIRTALRKLLAQGEAERLHDFTGMRCRAGVWRWKPPEASFAEVAAQVRAMEQE
jgi:hypothetical protein